MATGGCQQIDINLSEVKHGFVPLSSHFVGLIVKSFEPRIELLWYVQENFTVFIFQNRTGKKETKFSMSLDAKLNVYVRVAGDIVCSESSHNIYIWDFILFSIKFLSEKLDSSKSQAFFSSAACHSGDMFRGDRTNTNNGASMEDNFSDLQ